MGKQSKHILIQVGILGVALGFILYSGYWFVHLDYIPHQSAQLQTTKITEYEIPTPTPSPTTKPQPQKASFTGVGSYYTRDGCIGCSPTLTMANGEPLDDSRLTVAFNKLPLNTQVLIINHRNGKQVTATVTDTGGFERHGRIVDVSLAVQQALDMRTDQDVLEIVEL